MNDNDQASTASEWLPLCDALGRLGGKLGDSTEAKCVLIEAAQRGDLKAIADRAFGFIEGTDLDTHDWPIPNSVWQRLNVPTDSEWQRGSLTADIHSDPRWDSRRHQYKPALQLTGVRIFGTHLEWLLQKLPTRSKGTADSTSAAERECEAWLVAQFAADAGKSQPKVWFRAEASKQFRGRLSQRGFARAWDRVARAAGRSKPGRKS